MLGMECDQILFTVRNLTGTSYANENFITNFCVSNLAKLIIFSLFLVMWFCALVWSLLTLYFEIVTVGFKWDLRKKIYTLTIISTVAEFISFLFYFFSIQSAVRYLFYSIAPQLTIVVISLSLKAWFETSINITFNTDERFQRSFTTALIIINVIMVTLTLSCCIIGPMVSFSSGNSYQVNWFYAIRTSGLSFISICIIFLIRFTGKKLVKACTGQHSELVQNSEKVKKLLEKLRILIKISTLCLPTQVFILTPIWMIWDLYGIFWFHFTINEINLFMAVTIMMWTIKIGGSRFGLSSDFSSSPPVSDFSNKEAKKCLATESNN